MCSKEQGFYQSQQADDVRTMTRIERRLERLTRMMKEMESLHSGKEITLTYHAGFNLGYMKGKIAEIENTIDEGLKNDE